MEILWLFSVRYVHGTSPTWQGVLGTHAVLTDVGIVILAQFVFTDRPPMQAVFDTRPVAPADGAAMVAEFALLIMVEAEKGIVAQGAHLALRGYAHG